ncbi:hypothetical protein AAVH_31095 [Aphelenchoides avenae]|nr:hypothetical protein AAVH_31095 [Aphelenchus avenae]
MRDVDGFLERVVQAMLTNAKQKQKQVLSTRPPMLTQLDCHHETVHAFKRQCLAKMPKVTYALRFVNVLANLCEMGLPTNYIIRRFTELCLHADD